MQVTKTLYTAALLSAALISGCSRQDPPATTETSPAPAIEEQPGVDLVLTNGVVYTVDDSQRAAQAFAIKDDKFVAVGSNEEVLAMAGSNTRTIDAGGKFVLPGFIDTHFHSVAASIITSEFDTGEETNNEGMYAKLREFAASQPGRTEPLITYGWHLANFPKEGPRKEDLDAIFPDYPVLFIRSDGHGAWANSKALEVANITADTPDPTEQSFYQRDENGEPTGFIEEIPAYFGVYFPMIGEISEEWIEERVTKAFPKFSASGLTTVFDPGVLFAENIPAMNAIHAYNEKNGANLRVSMSHYSVNQKDDFAEAQALIANSRSEDVYSNSIKINVDGSIETGTGYLKEPYIEGSGLEDKGTGTTIFPIDEFKALVDKSYAAGINMHFHVCGDAGVALTLETMEEAIAKHGPNKARANLTHVMMTDPADMPRFVGAQAGVSYSALWMMPGDSVNDSTKVIGKERTDAYYPAGRTAAAGAKVGIGSDYPVATTFPSYAPLDSIEMFVRRARAGDPDAPTQGFEEDKLSLEQAIRAATIDNAWLMAADDEVGSISVGKSADFVILDQNLFDVKEHEISQVEVLATYYRGRQTHGN